MQNSPLLPEQADIFISFLHMLTTRFQKTTKSTKIKTILYQNSDQIVKIKTCISNKYENKKKRQKPISVEITCKGRGVSWVDPSWFDTTRFSAVAVDKVALVALLLAIVLFKCLETVKKLEG